MSVPGYLPLIWLYVAGIRTKVVGSTLRPIREHGLPPALSRLLDQRQSASLNLLHAVHLLARAPDQSPRTQAAALLHATRRALLPDLARELRHAWHERVAICVHDAGIPAWEAEEIAARQLWTMVETLTDEPAAAPAAPTGPAPNPAVLKRPVHPGRVWVSTGEPGEAIDRESRTLCTCCRGTRFFSRPGTSHWVCARCHPPGQPELMVWRGDEEAGS